jgi:hypothetical protein
MNIQQIALRLNFLAKEQKHQFSQLQQIRKKHLKNVRSNQPFAKFSIKSDYAFHAGGRKELQFNVGEDRFQGQPIFRFGVAFSLNEDRTLHDSKAEFKDKIDRFNTFLAKRPDFFSNYQMWYYRNGRYANFFPAVVPVVEELYQTENFVFVGSYFNKSTSQILDSDLEQILDVFDHLLELYQIVQFSRGFNEKKISRICWNENQWVRPSGYTDKSNDKKTHEYQYGYGHDEWLFDTGKLLEKYHYGFLEPIAKGKMPYVGKKFDVWLYTINRSSKIRYYIGEIKNVIVISEQEARKVKDYYRSNGWLREMHSQIADVGADNNTFFNYAPIDIFNVKFLPQNIKLAPEYIEVDQGNKLRKVQRYTLAEFLPEYEENPKTEERGFIFPNNHHQDDLGDEDQEVKKRSSNREAKPVQITYLHEQISKKVTRLLKKKYDRAHREVLSGYGRCKIDIVAKDGDKIIFYEIKTYNSLITCIREAIGQILEYAYWPESENANELIIISQHPIEPTAKRYLNFLRSKFLGLNLYYQSYDGVKNILSEKE